MIGYEIESDVLDLLRRAADGTKARRKLELLRGFCPCLVFPSSVVAAPPFSVSARDAALLSSEIRQSSPPKSWGV